MVYIINIIVKGASLMYSSEVLVRVPMQMQKGMLVKGKQKESCYVIIEEQMERLVVKVNGLMYMFNF